MPRLGPLMHTDPCVGIRPHCVSYVTKNMYNSSQLVFRGAVTIAVPRSENFTERRL